MIGMVILNYNDWPTVIDYISLVSNYKIIKKIVVVDNCSTDDSWEHLSNSEYEIDCIRSDCNKGYSAGNNIGVKYLLNTYKGIDKIIISNPDIFITEEDLKKIVSELEKGYSIATGLIYNSDKTECNIKLASNWGWKVPDYRDILCNCFLSTYKFLRAILKKGIYYDIKKYERNSIIDVECVPGCFFAISKELLENISFFDERTFLFGEETILGFQAKLAGKKVCVVNDTRILHKQSTSINKSIKSNKVKNKHLLNSYDVYIKEYLGCNHLHVALFHLLFHIGIIEKRILSLLFAH